MRWIIIMSLVLLSSCGYYVDDYGYQATIATPSVSTVTVISRPAFITPVIAPYDNSIRWNYSY